MKFRQIAILLGLLLILPSLTLAKKQTSNIKAPETTRPESPLSIDHMLGVYTFARMHPNTYMNGYIEFFPDHNWTFVVHYDDDKDRITDRHEILKGTYEVRKTAQGPAFILHENGKPDDVINDYLFVDKKVDSFSLRGFGFTRRKPSGSYFDQALNIADIAKDLKVETDPPGAAVYLDGVRVEGNTPLVVKGPPAGRPLSVRIEMMGFSPKKTMVELNPNESKEIFMQLVSGESELWIATKPWTRVILDGKYVGDAPIKLRDLSAGLHRVKLENSGAKIEDSFDIELPENDIVKKVIEYTGNLDLLIDKKAKIVDRNGKVIGKAPIQGLKLPVGNHTLRLVDENKNMKILVVRIRLNDTTKVTKNWKDLDDWKD